MLHDDFTDFFFLPRNYACGLLFIKKKPCPDFFSYFVLFLSAVVPRSKSPREPDVFELPPLPSTASAANAGWG